MWDSTREIVSWPTAINYALDDNTINLLPNTFSFFNAILLIPFFYVAEFIRVEFMLLIGVALPIFLKKDNYLDKVSYLILYLWVKSIVNTIILANNELLFNSFYKFFNNFVQSLTGNFLLILTRGLPLGLALGLAGGFTYNWSEGVPLGLALGFAGSWSYNLIKDLGLALPKNVALSFIFGVPYGLARGLVYGLAFGFAFSLAGGLPFGLNFGLPLDLAIKSSENINSILSGNLPYIFGYALPFSFIFSVPFILAGVFVYLAYYLTEKEDLPEGFIFGFWGTLSGFLAYGSSGGLAGSLAVSFTNKIMNLVNKKFKNIILLLYALIFSSNKYIFPIIFIIKILFYKFNFIKFSEVNQSSV